MSKKDQSDQRIMEKIVKGQLEIKQKIHPLLEKLIRLMLVYEPNNRISFEEAEELIEEYKNHPK
jgi:hypothetical protein